MSRDICGRRNMNAILQGGGGRREAVSDGRHASTFPVLSTGRIRRVASGWFGVSTPSNGSLFSSLN